MPSGNSPDVKFEIDHVLIRASPIFSGESASIQ
jgi:hypothetical protein